MVRLRTEREGPRTEGEGGGLRTECGGLIKFNFGFDGYLFKYF